MLEANNMFDLLIDSLKKVLYPEEWIDFDMSFSKTELFAMLLIHRQGEIIMSQVADYINVPMSTATGIVERLVKNGYILRERSETDRRIVTIKLTPKGEELITRFKDTVMQYINEINSSLTGEEKQLLLKVFAKFVKVLESKNAAILSGEIKEKKIKKIEIE
ncbi:MAG: MarR family transcriptional regulator [Clostridia bacterium]|nr:MarR family transcriptional regulator [Clostridia bacterium]